MKPQYTTGVYEAPSPLTGLERVFVDNGSPQGEMITIQQIANLSAASVSILTFRYGVTDDVALGLAFASLPATGGTIILPAIGSPYNFVNEIALSNKPIALVGDSSASVQIFVKHPYQALAINQTNGANNIEIRGLTFTLTPSGRSQGCIDISYPGGGESPSPAVKIWDVAINVSATGAPIWDAGITLNGNTSPPATLGVVQIGRYSFTASNTALPAPIGTYGLLLNSVNDVDVKDYTSTNCDAAIYVGSYSEGLRFQTGSCVSNNWLMKMAPGMTLGPGTPGGTLTIQKMWFHDWEIATYSGGFNVYSISESFLSDMDFVGLFGSNWTAFLCQDCFGWQGSNIYIDGLVATGVPQGFNLTASGAIGQYCGDFQFPNLSTNRLSYSVNLGANVSYCSFENLLPRFGVPGSSLPVNNVIDSSGNATNRITFGNKNGNLSSAKGYLQFDALDYSPGIKFTFGIGAVNYLNTLNAGTGNAPTLAAAGTDTNISLALMSKGTGAIAFQNSNGIIGEIFAPATAANYLTQSAVAAGLAPTLAAVGSDSNVSLQLNTKGLGELVLTNGTNVTMTVLTVANAANYPSLSAVGTGNAVNFGAAGSDANINIALTPQGTGWAYLAGYPLLASEGVSASTTNTVTNKVKVVIPGVGTIYLLASTSAT